MRSGKAALVGPDTTPDSNNEYCPELNNVAGSTGTAKGLGCKKLGADVKNNFLYESCNGDYAVGMQLTSTMRVAKCDGNVAANKNTQCSVFSKSLAYSNAETGWSLVGTSLLGLFPDTVANLTGADVGASALTSDFTKKDQLDTEDFLAKPDPNAPVQPSLLSFLQSSDVNDVNSNTYKRNPQKDLITNHIEAKDFSAEFQDICSGSDAADRCKIYIYSVFNRYYNSYYSGSMLITMAGPAVYGLGKKVMPKSAQTFFDKIGTKLTKAKVSMFSISGAEKDAVKAAEAIRTGIVSNPSDLEKLFNEGSADKLRKAFDDIAKSLDTPEKKRAFAKYLSTKSNYATAFKAELSGMSDSEAVEFLLAQDKVKTGLGSSIIDVFYEKNPQYNQYFALDSKTSKGYVALSDKAAKESVLKGEIPTLYKPTGLTPVSIASPDQLRIWATNPADKYFIESGGIDVLVTKDNVEELIGKFPGLTNLPVKKAGGFVDITKLDPVHPDPTKYTKLIEEMQGGFRKQGDKVAENVGKRSDDLLATMKERNLIDKVYWNPLQWQLYNQKVTWENNKLRSVFNWVIMPQIYWQVKAGDTPLKAYFVNEKELSNVLINTGESYIYDDSYIDFFANESFSSGDFFGESFVKPVSKLVGTILPEGDIQKNFLNFAGIKAREDVKNIVYWTATNDNCPDCSLTEKIADNGMISVLTNAKTDTNNYIVELPPTEDARVGLSLAAFTHHTNIAFNLNSTNNESNVKDNINIEEAVTSQETCKDKVKSVWLGQLPVLGDWFYANASRTGLFMGIGENTLFYVANSMLPGTMGILMGGVSTYILDDWFMSSFDGCVDAEEGYYIHYVHRFEEESQKQGAIQSLISKGKSTIESDPNESLDKLDKTIMEVKNKLIDVVSNKDKEFLQIQFVTKADYPVEDNANGKFMTNGLFLSWVDAKCHPIEYDDKSFMVAISKDKNGMEHITEFDNQAGTISQDGKVILQSDLVKLRSWNKNVRGWEIPQSSTFIPADFGVDYFEFMPNGDYRILDASTEMCFMDGCTKQTGFSYSSPIQYTGLITEIHSSNSGKILPQGSSFLLQGGVTERQDIPAALTVDGNIDLVTTDRLHSLGKVKAVAFQKAIMLYRETERDFVLWIRVIAQINGRNVQKFWGTPTTVTNPETGCEEQAIDLSVLGIQNDATAKAEGETFDKALKHAGPFQYFETPDYTIMFYSKREASGECKQYMKVIDKKTGQVISDSAIKSMVTNPDGTVTFTTEDGKPHTIGFSNEGGVPMLSYNGKKGQLLMAQGRNGSFYFDPDTGEWTVGNSQLMPFSDDFKDGRLTDGSGKTVASPNPLVPKDTSIGTKGSWDIPLFDGNEKYLFVVLSVLVAIGLIYLSLSKK